MTVSKASGRLITFNFLHYPEALALMHGIVRVKKKAIGRKFFCSSNTLP